MKLVSDVLDTLVVDRDGREIGRADSIVLELRSGAPPRVAALELGPGVLFARVSPALGRWAAGLQYALGFGDGRPRRIPYEKVIDIDRHIRVDVAAKR